MFNIAKNAHLNGNLTLLAQNKKKLEAQPKKKKIWQNTK